MKKEYLIGVIVLSLIVGIYALYKFCSHKHSKNALQNIDNRTLTVGTTADFPPFSFRSDSDEITGFDIDIVKEVAKRIGFDIDIVDRQFSLLLPQAQLGQIQIIAAGMTPTEERAKKIRFTEPHLQQDPLVIVSLKTRDTGIKGLEDLKFKNIVVNTGYTADSYISSLPEDKGLHIIRLSKVEDAMLALNHGKADAFITAKLTLKPYLHNSDKDKYDIVAIPGTNESSSLGISKMVPDKLFEKINNAIDSIKKDGTLETIQKKWGFL